MEVIVIRTFVSKLQNGKAKLHHCETQWNVFEESILDNCIGGVMVSVIASNAVDLGFEHWSDQTRGYNIGICCFSAKHTALRSLSKDWLSETE